MASKENGGLISRRRFLGYSAGVVGGFTALAVGVPLVSSLVSPVIRKREATDEWTDLGDTKNFAIDKPAMVKWSAPKKDGYLIESAERSVWVYTQDGKEFTVWNPRCTHLGCAVFYDDKTRTFSSPCHGGIFALPDGKVIGGPPPRPLDTLPSKIENGKLYAKYMNFKLGVGEKSPQ